MLDRDGRAGRSQSERLKSKTCVCPQPSSGHVSDGLTENTANCVALQWSAEKETFDASPFRLVPNRLASSDIQTKGSHCALPCRRSGKEGKAIQFVVDPPIEPWPRIVKLNKGTWQFTYNLLVGLLGGRLNFEICKQDARAAFRSRMATQAIWHFNCIHVLAPSYRKFKLLVYCLSGLLNHHRKATLSKRKRKESLASESEIGKLN